MILTDRILRFKDKTAFTECIMISVIIPVYNTVEYLNKCIESVINQTYQDLEIILIDDCSNDGSSEILDNWGKKDSRITVIHKESNSGVSDSRNIGLKLSKGEFIGFVDSDDWLEPDMYAELHHWIEKTNADVAFGGYNRVRNEKIIRVCPAKSSGDVLTVEEAFLHCIPQRGEGRYDLFIWNKLYRRSALLIDDEVVLFDTKFSYGEDVLWIVQVLMNSHYIALWNGCGYNYRVAREGNTWTELNKLSDLSYCENALLANKTIMQHLHEVNSKSENNALQRVLFYQKRAIRTAANINDSNAYKEYSKGYIKGLIIFWIRNRTLIGLAWTGKQILSHSFFALTRGVHNKNG